MQRPPQQNSWHCPVPLRDFSHIVLGHGGGGRLTADLLEHLIRPAFDNPFLARQADGAELPVQTGRLVVTADSYVVRPLIFPGGSIGELAVHGTLNDLAMMGARAKYLTMALILEEGLPLALLAEILHRAADAARAASVLVVAGDTKVIERCHGEGCFITTTGLGWCKHEGHLSPDAIAAGDAVLLSGTIAEHGIAVLSQREGLQFESAIISDTANLQEIALSLLEAVPVRMFRDPTRGGVAATLNEIAHSRRFGIEIIEQSIPVQPAVRSACDLLGLDPLAVANEGKFIAIVPDAAADEALARMRSHPLGRNAVRIGTVVSDHPGHVVARTPFGAKRMVPLPAGELLPRIC